MSHTNIFFQYKTTQMTQH